MSCQYTNHGYDYPWWCFTDSSIREEQTLTIYFQKCHTEPLPGVMLSGIVKQSSFVLPQLLQLQCLTSTTATVAEWYKNWTVACLVTSSSPVPLKTRHVGQQCTLNLSRAETSSNWCGVVVRRGGASSGFVHVTLAWFKITWSVAKSPRVAKQCDVNNQSILRVPLLCSMVPTTKSTLRGKISAIFSISFIDDRVMSHLYLLLGHSPFN
ncbi:uncharacterized protein TNCV_2288431 [Trichonephila clavipes]|nr:uncharacterized protein TNCV_2288431 [Trichonephila clavipes]